MNKQLQGLFHEASAERSILFVINDRADGWEGGFAGADKKTGTSIG